MECSRNSRRRGVQACHCVLLCNFRARSTRVRMESKVTFVVSAAVSRAGDTFHGIETVVRAMWANLHGMAMIRRRTTKARWTRRRWTARARRGSATARAAMRPPHSRMERPCRPRPSLLRRQENDRTQRETLVTKKGNPRPEPATTLAQHVTRPWTSNHGHPVQICPHRPNTVQASHTLGKLSPLLRTVASASSLVRAAVAVRLGQWRPSLPQP